MKIKLELDSLQASLDMVSRLAPPTSGNITFVSDGKKVKIISSADLSRCLTVVPCEVDKSGEFAIPLQALRDAVKGRAKLELIYKNSMLSVLSGKYRADLTTVDVVPLDDIDAEDGKELKLNTDQSGWLKKALRDVALKPTALFSSWMPVGIKLTEKSAFVCCFDTQHMSWTTSKEVTGDFECVLPLDTMTAVIDLFHKTPFIIRQTKTRVEIKTKYAQVYLNTPTLDDLPSLSDVQSKIKEASKMDSSTFKFNKDQFMVFMDNAKSVIGKERPEVSVTGGKVVETSITTGQGTVTASIEGSGKGKFKIDYEFLLEGMSKINGEMTMNVVHEAFASMKLASSSIIIALNQ